MFFDIRDVFDGSKLIFMMDYCMHDKWFNQQPILRRWRSLHAEAHGQGRYHRLGDETDTVDKMKRCIEHDLYYIENWSLFRGFVHENAY